MISVRPARLADAAEIAALLRTGFEKRVRPLTPYGCVGAGSYVRGQLGRGAPWADGAYFVAASGGRVVGCAEIRCHADAAFLNYVAVDPGVRRSGVGTCLLRGALSRLLTDGRIGGRFELDVFAHNAKAVRWYRGLGLQQSGQYAWHVRSVREGRAAADPPRTLRLCGMPQAEVMQAKLGFSEFRVENGERTYRIGRLGRGWYRLTDPRAATDRDLLALLARLSPRRSLLLIARAPAPRVPWPVFLRGIRMEAPLGLVMERLSAREPLA